MKAKDISCPRCGEKLHIAEKLQVAICTGCGFEAKVDDNGELVDPDEEVPAAKSEQDEKSQRETAASSWLNYYIHGGRRLNAEEKKRDARRVIALFVFMALLFLTWHIRVKFFPNENSTGPYHTGFDFETETSAEEFSETGEDSEENETNEP